jgi:hypothetical protein
LLHKVALPQEASYVDYRRFRFQGLGAYKPGIAREHAYRPALHNFLKAPGDDLTPINDAAKSKVGALDFVILKGEIASATLRPRITTWTFASSRTRTRARKTATSRSDETSVLWAVYCAGQARAERHLRGVQLEDARRAVKQ